MPLDDHFLSLIQLLTFGRENGYYAEIYWKAEEKLFVKNLLPITGNKFLNNLLAASQGNPNASKALSGEYLTMAKEIKISVNPEYFPYCPKKIQKTQTFPQIHQRVAAYMRSTGQLLAWMPIALGQMEAWVRRSPQ